MDEIVASQVGAGGPWYIHHYDASGNCILQSNAAGAVQVQYEYDAFGYPYPRGAMGGKGASQTRFLFTGREWLGDLRLYDYRNRLYQPEIGRFLQPDPKQFEAGDYNLYRYCHNDPINKADPDGLTVVVDISDPGFFVIESMALHEVAATESGGKAIAQLEDSQNLHIISPKQDFVTSKFNAGDERSAVTTATNVADSHNGCGSGSRIEINPSDQQNYNDTPASQLGHEIGHAQDIDSGNAAEPSRGSGLNYYAGPAEENALKIEMEVKKNQ
jgi:RHS repeat-associated protein